MKLNDLFENTNSTVSMSERLKKLSKEKIADKQRDEKKKYKQEKIAVRP